MFDKLKAVITGRFNAMQQAEIDAKVNEHLADIAKREAAFVEKNVKDKYKIKKAFELDGKIYFHFEDTFSLAYGRGIAASEIYNEFSQKCSREFLQAHCKAVLNAINNKNGIEITKIATLTQQLQERLDLVVDVELLYKLASVIYFSEDENPYDYDFKYNLTKIQEWKSKNLASFFLLNPLRDLIPFTDLSEADLETYIQVGKKINKTHLESISTMLSEKDKKQDFYKTIASQLNMDTV
jgi:hypothetical protein